MDRSNAQHYQLGCPQGRPLVPPTATQLPSKNVPPTPFHWSDTPS
jgi:hypothetical protein